MYISEYFTVGMYRYYASVCTFCWFLEVTILQTEAAYVHNKAYRSRRMDIDEMPSNEIYYQELQTLVISKNKASKDILLFFRTKGHTLSDAWFDTSSHNTNLARSTRDESWSYISN